MKKSIGTKLGAVAIACICLLGVGCSKPACTSDDGLHSWGRWENERNGKGEELRNGFGKHGRIRYCETCNLNESICR